VFQQVSVFAASAIMCRLLLALMPPLEHEGLTLYQFPSVECVLKAKEDTQRAAGLSSSKLTTLRRVGKALALGALDEPGARARARRDHTAEETQATRGHPPRPAPGRCTLK
jgi:3-methyladenine DNA glycosylase/8-oxoguanine DNA glycosylase